MAWQKPRIMSDRTALADKHTSIERTVLAANCDWLKCAFIGYLGTAGTP